MQKTVVAAAAFILAFSLNTGVTLAQPTSDVSGRWRVSTSGDALVATPLRIDQNGPTVSGSYGQGGRLDGAFKPGSLQVDGNWTDARGSGWMTIIFAEDGKRFSGEWGYPGRRPSGTFVASRLAPAYPALLTRYYVSVSGGQEFPVARRMTVHQLGQSVVGNFGPFTELHGSLAPDPDSLVDTFTGSWKGPEGQGWMRLQFAPDSRSFQGEWGLTADTQARGHIDAGTMYERTASAPVRVVRSASRMELGVAGLWKTASSSSAFPIGTLTLRQNGDSVVGTYKDGHLAGTLRPGSNVLTAHWRSGDRTGYVAFTFAADGKTFQGTWTGHGETSGSIIGSRVIAASPALRG